MGQSEGQNKNFWIVGAPFIGVGTVVIYNFKDYMLAFFGLIAKVSDIKQIQNRIVILLKISIVTFILQ